MNESTIHILCASDDNYASYYGIMLTSLFESNPDEDFHIHMMIGENSFCDETRSLYKRLMGIYHQKISYITVKASSLAHCPIRIGDHVTLATYYRLLAPALLPAELDKILWLDGDIIIDRPIGDLYRTDISNYGIGTVIDESYKNASIYERLGLNPQIPYTSAGVLLINLSYWRRHQLMERCMECINKMADKLLFHDQDTLNVVLQEQKYLLPVKWNFQSGFLRPWIFEDFDEELKQRIVSSADEPAIIHYSGPGKPWFKYNDHPYRPFFLYYKRLSLWKDTPLTNTYVLTSLVRDLAGRVFRLLHLKPSLYIVSRQRK